MEECLAAYTRIHPDIILLDAMMPVMDGFTCCAKQKHSLVEIAPVLIITGLEDEASVDWAFEVGAIDYVTKPIHWPVLRQRVPLRVKLSQQLERTQELQQLACLDSLTQIANRRRFDAYLDQEWKRMVRIKRLCPSFCATLTFQSLQRHLWPSGGGITVYSR